jgi:hypothetical protein
MPVAEFIAIEGGRPPGGVAAGGELATSANPGRRAGRSRAGTILIDTPET